MIEEYQTLDDKQTKALEWMEAHPEEADKLLESISQLINSIGKALNDVAEKLTPTIKNLAEMSAAVAESQREELKEVDPDDD